MAEQVHCKYTIAAAAKAEAKAEVAEAETTTDVKSIAPYRLTLGNFWTLESMATAVTMDSRIHSTLIVVDPRVRSTRVWRTLYRKL